MELPVNIAALWLLGLLGTILIGVITNAIWDWIKENVTLSSSKWPRLKGQWIITHPDGSRAGELAYIHQQFGPRFRGELHTPDPAAVGRMLVQEVRGELEDRYHALFTIRQKGDDFTEMGAGMITINANPTTAAGKSVFFGASAPQEGMSTFTMKKV
jgi:hypothetical protein